MTFAFDFLDVSTRPRAYVPALHEQVNSVTKMYLKSPLHPLTSYFFTYLLAGWYDGSHFNPFSESSRPSSHPERIRISAIFPRLALAKISRFRLVRPYN